MDTTTTQELTMDTTFRTSSFTSRHAFPQANNLNDFSAALADVAYAAATDHPMSVLVDYLAARVETHSPAARAQLTAVMADTDADLDKLETRLAAIESEAARTALVALDVNVGRIAPVDFPTLTRAWLIARNLQGIRV